MSTRVRAKIHPFKNEYTDLYCEAAPLSEIFAGLNSPLDITHARFLINDEITTDVDLTPPDGSTVYVNVVPEGTGSQTKDTGKGAFWGGLGTALLGVAALFIPVVGIALGAALIGTGVGMAIGGAVLMNVDIPTPSVPSARDTGNQMESIRGSKNQTRKSGYIPVLFGRHLITPDVAALPYTEIAADGQQWLTQLFCAGYNDMVIETGSFKVGDTALTELSKTKNIGTILAGGDGLVKLEIIQNGAPSTLYPKICVEQQFNATLKHSDSDGVLTPTVHTTPDKTTSINVDIIFPQGLIAYDDKGKKQSASVSVSIQYKPDSASAYTNFPGWNQNISGQTADMFRRQATVSGLSPGKYTVKITRVTGDSSDGKSINTVYVGSVRSFADDRPVRQEAAGNLAIIALKIRASTLASGVIDNFNFIAQSKIPDYTPVTDSWTPRLTANPASALLYALQGIVNPAPVADTDIDWDALREFWAFCNEKGYACNAVQGDRELFSVLCAKIAKTGRASVVRINSKFSVVIDKERPAPVQLFSPRNTTDYRQTIVKADIPDEIAVEFVDETTGWASNERSVYNTPDGLPSGAEKTKQTSSIWGITNPDIAFKFARYQYACITNRPIIHTLECDIEYLLCKKGDLIEYAGDTALTGIACGKITALIYTGAYITGITADTLFPQEAGQSYGIRCRKSDGRLITLNVVNQETSEKTLFLETPQPQGALEEGDLVIFGLTGKITRQLIITEITPADNFRATLTCVDYAPEIFAVDDPAYVVPPFDNKITTLGSVTDSGIGLPADRKIDIISGQIKIEAERIASRPTYAEIVEGFTQAGATVLPAQLSLSAAGGFRFITLSWTRQPYLSNLKEYQLQVSENAVDWYAPRFDGVDWKGGQDAVFPTAATLVVHPNIPPAGSSSAPAGRMLYYRVRQRTMPDDYSDWSPIVAAETKLADTGDYGANSISANTLKTVELFALFANIGHSLIVDPAGVTAENQAWAEGDTRAVLNAKEISFQYFLSRMWKVMARIGLEGVEASQFFSGDKLYLTNDDMPGRRSKGYDIGTPYLSNNSRVVHYDTDMLDQNGQALFAMAGTGALTGENEGIGIILKAAAPYATEARALYGNFRLQANIGQSSVFTVDFWMLYRWNENQVLFDIGNDVERVRIEILNDEPYLNDLDTAGIWLNDHAADGVWLNEIKLAHTRIAHYLNGNWEYTAVTSEDGTPGFIIDRWYHIGVVHTAGQVWIFINNQAFSFRSQAVAAPVQIDINPAQGQVDNEYSAMFIDEVLVDPSVAESSELFYQNTAKKRPWGKLDDQYPWFIINVQDPRYFKTNIFQSPDFTAAVRNIINGGS